MRPPGTIAEPSRGHVELAAVGARVRLARPDAEIIPLRGNVDTRLRKAAEGGYDAIVLAAAGLVRLGRVDAISEYLQYEVMLPDPGQGALAVQVRAEDGELATLVQRLDHAPSRAEVTAERALLRALGGGCRTPVGAIARASGARLSLSGLVASPDGARVARGTVEGGIERAESLGEALAEQLRHAGIV